jgi:hypothetical protein
VQVTEGNGYCLMLVFAACRMSLVGSRESQSLGSSIGHQRALMGFALSGAAHRA